MKENNSDGGAHHVEAAYDSSANSATAEDIRHKVMALEFELDEIRQTWKLYQDNKIPIEQFACFMASNYG